VNITSFLSLVGLFATTACIDGPELFKQDGSVNADYAIMASSDGGVTSGAFSAASSATQVMTVDDGAISGSAVAFPPGALAIDTTVLLQEGASIANSNTAAQLGIGSLSASGAALVVSSSTPMNASTPFTLNIGRSSGSSLALNEPNLVVVYLVYDAEKKTFISGVIPSSQLKITAESVAVSTIYFGSYQVATTVTMIAKATSVPTVTPILTKNAAAELPAISILVSDLKFKSMERKVHMSVKLSAPVGLVRCSMFAYRGKEPAWFDSESTSDAKDLREISRGKPELVDYHVKVKDPISLSFSFECLDTSGRSIASARTASIAVPKATQKLEIPPASIYVRFVPQDSIQQYPSGRIINSASPTRTISGDCDSNRGSVKVFINGGANPSDSSWPCQNNQFSFPLITTAVEDGKISLTHNDRGYRISASQGPDSKDETVIYNMVSTSKELVYVDSKSILTNVNSDWTVSSKFFILTTDIDLSGGVTAQFPALNAVFEGDLKEIRNLNSTTGGLFAGVNPNGRIRHLTIKNASVSNTESQSGTLAKSSSGEIEAVRCVNCTVTISAASLEKVGGLVGRMYGYGKLIDVSFNGTVNATLASEVGQMKLSSTISKSRVVATLESHQSTGVSEVGGIAGCAESGTISEVATDIVAVCLYPAVSRVGGVAGHAAALMLTHAWSQLTTSTCLNKVGGAVGETSSESTSSYLVTRANIGTCSSCGIFVGSHHSGATISHAFALSGSTSGLSTVGTGTGTLNLASNPSDFPSPEWITILASEGPILKNIPMLPLGPNP
jgi:hypothetical protein